MAEKDVCPKCGGHGLCFKCAGSGNFEEGAKAPDLHIADVDTGEETGPAEIQACPECLGTGTCQTCQGSGVKS